MKYYIYNRNDKTIIAEVEATCSMTLEEAIEAIGGEIKYDLENPWDANVTIDGKEYWTDDMDMTSDLDDING